MGRYHIVLARFFGLFWGLGGLGVLGGPTAFRSAAAKEQAAGCAGFPRALWRIEATIRLGAPIWNAGNQLATYALYRDATLDLMSRLVPDASCGALRGVLEGALGEARKRATPGSAGWDLRHGFDTFIEYVTRGDAPKLFAPRVIDQVAAPYFGEDCPGLFALVQRAEKALAEGRGADEAQKMARELAAAKSCPNVTRALAAAVKRRQGQAALVELAAGQPPAGEPGEPPAMLRGCTLLPSLVEELSFAVARGGPRFDAGQPEACLQIYKKAAETALDRYASGGHCADAAGRLRKGLAEAQHETDPGKAAWALRHAFDAIGEAFAKSIPAAP